jgi:hypothetical protein
MLLAELEVWHTRPAVPTRRVALGLDYRWLDAAEDRQARSG